MTQIINLLIFLKELLFNRGQKDNRANNKAGLLQTALIAILAISLYGNYVMVQRVYTKTKEIIVMKHELKELRPMAERVKELQHINAALSQTLALLTEGRRPLKTPAAPAPSPEAPVPPAAPANKGPRQPPNKENTVK